MLIAAIFDKVSALIFLLRLFTPFPTTKGQKEQKKTNLSEKGERAGQKVLHTDKSEIN